MILWSSLNVTIVYTDLLQRLHGSVTIDQSLIIELSEAVTPALFEWTVRPLLLHWLRPGRACIVIID